MDKDTEASCSENQPESGAFGELLELARAFVPHIGPELPNLAACPHEVAADATTEERIHKAEVRYQTLVEQIPAVTFRASFENGLSEIYVSPYIEALLGYTAREWIDEPILWYQRLHPEDRSRWTKEFSRTISWAEPFRADYRFLAKDGRTVWIHGEARVVRDASGRPSFVQGIGYDITERKAAEEVLKRSRQELERLVNTRTTALESANRMLEAQIIERFRLESRMEQTIKELADVKAALDEHAIVAITDAAGKIIYANDKFCAISKYAREELIGQDHRIINSGHHPRDFFRGLWQTISHGRVWKGEIKNRAKDGTFYWVDTTIVPYLDERGRPYQYIAIRADITERKTAEEGLQRVHAELESRVAQRTEALARATEEAERANQAKSEFLSRMSHELRTPLNAILGFAQVMDLEQDLGGRQRESVAQILKGGRHLLELINEVLDISRIESGHMAVSLQPVSARELMAEAFCLVAPMADEHGVRLAMVAPDHRDWHVLADRRRLKQVLLNLLTNAIKYNEAKGEVIVNFEPTRTSPRPLLRLSVKDTGPGLAPEKLSRLFRPFDRLDAERTRAGIEGTGLGLALSQRLVVLMNGSLGVESCPGQGSTFWIELPLAEDPARTEKDSEVGAVTGQQKPANRARTVLVIEDNPANLELMRYILEQRPATRLLDAPTGSQGVELAHQHLPDVVLLDLNLPDINGDQVLKQLRSDPRTAGIPVLVISGDANLNKIEQLLALGARDYVTKPFDVRKFLALLDDVFEQNQR